MSSSERPRIVRVEEVFRETLDPPTATDAQIRLEPCPNCGTRQMLAECSVRLVGHDTEYICKTGDWVLAKVSPPWSPTRSEGEGWNMRGYVLRPFVGMHVLGRPAME